MSRYTSVVFVWCNLILSCHSQGTLIGWGFLPPSQPSLQKLARDFVATYWGSFKTKVVQTLHVLWLQRTYPQNAYRRSSIQHLVCRLRVKGLMQLNAYMSHMFLFSEILDETTRFTIFPQVSCGLFAATDGSSWFSFSTQKDRGNALHVLFVTKSLFSSL